MIHEQFKKGKMTNWFLPVVLLLSLFTFSGINNSSATKHNKALTEQVDPLRVSKKKVVSFPVFNAESQLKSDHSAGDFQQISIFHARILSTQIKQCARHG